MIFAVINNVYLVAVAVSRLLVTARLTGIGGMARQGALNMSDPAAVTKMVQDNLDDNFNYLHVLCGWWVVCRMFRLFGDF